MNGEKEKVIMSFCPNCGNQLEEGVAFCDSCGVKIADFKVEEKTSTGVNSSSAEAAKQKVMSHLPKSKKVLFGGIAAAVVLLIVIITVVNMRKTVDVSKYLEVEYEGYNGYGTVNVELNDEFEDKINSIAKKGNKKSKSEFEDWFGDEITAADMIEEYLDWDVDPNENLSNGDTITVTIDLEDAKEVAEEYGIKLKGDKATFTVENLEDIKEINPFEDVDVEFSGVNGSVTAEIVNNSKDEFVQELYFSMDQSYDLSIGDTVTVSLESSDPEYYASMGYILTQTSKEYTCKAADEYVSKVEDIDSNTLSQMQSQAQDIIESTLENTDEFALSGWTYKGMYILNRKSDSFWGSDNYVELIYTGKLDPAGDTESFETKYIFVPIIFTNVLKKVDGTINVEITDAYVDSNYHEIVGWTGYNYGYLSGKEMYESEIKNNKADFTYAISKDLQEYGK